MWEMKEDYVTPRFQPRTVYLIKRSVFEILPFIWPRKHRVLVLIKNHYFSDYNRSRKSRVFVNNNQWRLRELKLLPTIKRLSDLTLGNHLEMFSGFFFFLFGSLFILFMLFLVFSFVLQIRKQIPTTLRTTNSQKDQIKLHNLNLMNIIKIKQRKIHEIQIYKTVCMLKRIFSWKMPSTITLRLSTDKSSCREDFINRHELQSRDTSNH